MTTLEIEARLMRHFDFTKNLIVPCVTNAGKLGFEADLLILTPAGYATVVEIKVSKADLRNDLKKNHIKYLSKPMKSGSSTGYDYYYKNLKYFYYAVPAKLEKAALHQIPDFCGLLVVENVKTAFRSISYTSVRAVREPKQLFNSKWSDPEIFNIARLGTMRISGLKHSILSYQNTVKQLRTKTKNYEN